MFVEEVLQTLNDLIEYFKQPDSELEHEEKQSLLRSIIKRQDLFKEEVSRQMQRHLVEKVKKKTASAGFFKRKNANVMQLLIGI